MRTNLERIGAWDAPYIDSLHSSELSHNRNPHPKTLDYLTSTDFRSFTALGLAVHSHQTLGDQRFAATTALRHAGKFE